MGRVSAANIAGAPLASVEHSVERADRARSPRRIAAFALKSAFYQAPPTGEGFPISREVMSAALASNHDSMG